MTSTPQTLSVPAGPSAGLVKLWLPIFLFGLLWADMVRQLSFQWEASEQYAYGWFVPFLAVALFWKRWLTRPSHPQPSTLNPQPCRPLWLSALVALAFISLLPIRVVHEINPDWPLVNWLLALVVVALSLYAIYLAGGWPWVRHFAFPVCFILVAVRWPYRIEHNLTQGLMQVVASLTVEIVGWFNIPAFQRGNLIEISTGVVGIDEACSGIRSFQSTIMVALFLGELYFLSLPRRAAMLVGGVILSFSLNVVRTLILTWQAATAGLSALEKWHDPAGMMIFLISFACLCGLAVWLRRGAISQPSTLNPSPQDQETMSSTSRASQPSAFIPHPSPASPSTLNSQPSTKQHPSAVPSSDLCSLTSDLRSPSAAPQPSTLNSQPRFPRRYLLAIGCWTILCVIATEIWYRAHEIKDVGVFHWSVVLPESTPGFAKVELPDRSLKLLKFDLGAMGRWKETDGSDWTLYFFRWNPSSVESVIHSRSHRPDVCLPAAGLRQVSESKLEYFDAGPFKLPFRSYVFEAQGHTMHVFFCQWEDGSEKQAGLEASKQAGRLQSVLTGRRLVGQQTLELILSGHESLAQAETELRRRLPELIRRDVISTQPKTLSQRAP